MTVQTPAYLKGLVRELCKLPSETGWLEFKENKANPQEIGQYISALANSATLAGKTRAYLVWGVDDRNHSIVGTTFEPGTAKKGNEDLESWLLRLLTPPIDFQFSELEIDGQRLVILEICQATRQPVQFEGQEFVRVGSYKKKLKQFPEKERELWRLFEATPFEAGSAAEHIPDDKILQLLDYTSYFELMKIPLPEGRKGILSALAGDSLISPSEAGGWDISNLGGMLFAKRLDAFPRLKRKAMRIISYRGNSRIQTANEEEIEKGYASSFESAMNYIKTLIPSNEVIGNALRKSVPMYPILALREVVANALIHQDFLVTGAGPMVELFEDRIEITNPGTPLVDVARFLDTPPRSRNEALASLMRRMGICEERGSGVDKIVQQVEEYQLPAPLFEVVGESTRVTLYTYQPLNKMDKKDRVRACYQHACLKYVSNSYLTNQSMRDRFGIDQKNTSTASRLIREAVDQGVIVPYDPSSGPKYMKYVPSWVVT